MAKEEKRTKDKSEKKEKKEKNARKDSDASSKHDIEEEVQRLLGSGEWKAMKHDETGKTYYYHTKTKQTCWDLKKELIKQRKNAVGESKTATPRSKTETTSTTPPGDSATEKGQFSKNEKKSTSATERRRDDEVHSNGSSELEYGRIPTKRYTTNNDSGKRGNAESNNDTNKQSHTLVPFSEKGKDFLITETYKDPLERLMTETNRLEQLMASSGTSQAMALEFQRSYEALARTNKALTAQMVKMKQEYDAMGAALRDANMEVYEKDLALREAQSHTRVVNKEEETTRTLAFLREQNQELVRQVGELTVALSRGFNEMSYQQTLSSGGGGGDSMNPERMAANPPQLRMPHQQTLGATLDSLIANPIVQKCLCGTCSGELERLRLSLLPNEERATARGNEKSIRTGSMGAHHAQYTLAGSPATPFDRFGHPVNPCQTQQTQQSLRGYHAQNFFDEGYGNGNGNGHPLQQQQRQQGVASGYSDGYVPQAPVPTDTYGDHFPVATMDRRSVPRASVLSASPVFGGFRIRPAY